MAELLFVRTASNCTAEFTEGEVYVLPMRTLTCSKSPQGWFIISGPGTPDAGSDM